MAGEAGTGTREEAMGEDAAPTEVAGQTTTGPQGDLSILSTISSTYKDEEGLISTGPIEFTYRNFGSMIAGMSLDPETFVGAASDARTSADTLESGTAAVISDFDPKAMGIFTQLYAGQIFHIPHEGSIYDSETESYTETTFRLYAPFQSFDPASPSIGADFDAESGDSEQHTITYSDDEIDGLADKFPYLPSSTSTEDLIQDAMLSMAIDVLQTFPSKQLHYSKAKHPRITSNNLKAFRTNELAQGMNIQASYEGTHEHLYGDSAELGSSGEGMVDTGTAEPYE